MMDVLWPWILTIVGCTGMFLAGSGKKSGWFVGLLTETLWLLYAYQTSQWGFIPASFLYASVFIRNIIVQRRRKVIPPR